MQRLSFQQPIKGRGTLSNRSGRFEAERREVEHDGWEEPEDQGLRPRTEVLLDKSRAILARNSSPDVPFDVSINPYRGCEHGCVYCFARPTHAYLGFSPGLDFETKILAKPEAPRLLADALSRTGYQVKTIALGANTDPYQPVERRMKITRGILETLAACDHPVAIVTKSALVLRDVDLLADMARKNLVRVCLSITTLDRGLARLMEPRASTPEKRLGALRALTQAGVPTAVLASPMIPALNDMELEAILEAAANAGAGSASYILLRLPLEIKDLFEEWLEAHFPDRKKRILDLIRETRGGALYKSGFGTRMRGEGVYAELLAGRFALAVKRYGLSRRNWSLDESRFRPPAVSSAQLSLF